MTHFSIKDLEAFSGVKKHTIRIWEQRYAFLQPKRTMALRRVYTPKELTLLLDVARLNQGGFRVSRIAKLMEEKSKPEIHNIEMLQLKAIHDLIITMAEMEIVQFESILQEAIQTWGEDDAIQKVIFPFCDRVGLLQKIDQCSYYDNVILIVEVIKQKLYAAIDHMPPALVTSKKVLLFLMKGENQTLPILYLHYRLKRDGYQVYSLGAHVSIESLTTIIRCAPPNFLITSQLEKGLRMELLQFVKHLPTYAAHTKLLTIGTALPKLDHLEYYQHCDSLTQAMELLLED